MNLSDLVHSQGYGFTVTPEPWLQPGVQGNPPDPHCFTAMVCHDSGRRYIACIADELDHVYACAHEIAEDQYGHDHSELVLSRQSQILARWLRQVADLRATKETRT